MKKVYKNITSVAFSLLVMGVTAQNVKPASGPAVPSKANAKQLTLVHQVNKPQNNQAQRTQSLTHVDVAYFNTDAVTIFPSTYTRFIPPAYTNDTYTINDTGSVKKNYNLNTSGIVAFDSILDVANTAYKPNAGTLSVDTIFMSFGYHNTSGTNDSIIINIGSVTPAGYPTGTFYTSDTVVIPPHSAALPGYNLDSVYTVYIVPNGGLGFTVPAAAASGYKFNVTVITGGSKLDTIGLQYGAPYLLCSGTPFAQRTGCGPKMGAAKNVNSFMTGFFYYNDANFAGNGTSLTWPDSAGNLYNSAFTFGDYWTTSAACPGDTGYIYTQDLFVEAAVTFGTPLAVNNVSSGSFSVDQNHPNPFNQNTVITYTLPKESDVAFTVYDMAGRELVNNNYSTVSAGQHEISLDAKQFTPGIYFYAFNINGVKLTKKMVITE